MISLRKYADTAGLESELQVGVGARVMLRRNIDLEKGLCNGVLGTVQNIVNGQDGKIAQILVEFDHIPVKNIAIEHVTADYEIYPGVYVTRKQFHLCLAYAITIHKSQGIRFVMSFE